MGAEAPKKLRVFIGWAGQRSKMVALALREWLPRVIQAVDPFMSEFIDKGSPWPERLDEELQAAHIGVICLTRENLNEPWISFEAGALYMSLQQEKVCPYLIDLSKSEVPWPLAKLQASAADKDDTQKLLERMNKAIAENGLPPLDPNILTDTFNEQWEKLEKVIQDARALPLGDKTEKNVTRSKEDILEEVLTLLRDQARIATTAEQRLDRIERMLSAPSRFYRPPSEAANAITPLSGSLSLQGSSPSVRSTRATGAAYSFSPAGSASPSPQASPSPEAPEQDEQ